MSRRFRTWTLFEPRVSFVTPDQQIDEPLRFLPGLRGSGPSNHGHEVQGYNDDQPAAVFFPNNQDSECMDGQVGKWHTFTILWHSLPSQSQLGLFSSYCCPVASPTITHNQLATSQVQAVLCFHSERLKSVMPGSSPLHSILYYSNKFQWQRCHKTCLKILQEWKKY